MNCIKASKINWLSVAEKPSNVKYNKECVKKLEENEGHKYFAFAKGKIEDMVLVFIISLDKDQKPLLGDNHLSVMPNLNFNLTEGLSDILNVRTFDFSMLEEVMVKTYGIAAATDVDWDNKNGEKPNSRRIPVYDGEKLLKELNSNHHTINEERGTYIGTDFEELVGRTYKFKISVDSNENKLLGANNYIAIPCPDFCTTGGE